MKRAHCFIAGACSWLTDHAGALFIGLAVVWMGSAPPSASGQSAWPNYPNNTAISVTSSGNVGVGTTSPQQKLDVAGSIRLTSYVYAPVGSYLGFLTDATWALPIKVGGLTIASNYGATNPAYGLYVEGNVGIGASNPAAKLDIQTGTVFQTAAKVWHTGNGNNPGQVLQVSNGYGVGAGNYEVLGVYGNSFGLSYLNVKDNGNVGIGTTNPQYKLAVNGTIGAKDVIVTNTGWSDYVFKPGHRLRPLREVGAYIRAHRHLPEIPSEAEVKQKGLSVGDMQARLLAKIEELTLYMIQQDKENQELRERIGRLETRAAGR